MAWDELHKKMIKSGFEMDWGASLTESVMPYLEHSKHILDLGCGQGHDSIRLARMGLHVTSVDLSENAINSAREHAESENLKIDFRQMDMSSGLRFENSSFDVVLANLSLHYFSLERTQFIVQEIARILEPNGVLCLHLNSSEEGEKRRAKGSVISELEPGFFLERDGVTRRYFTQDDLDLFLQNWSIVKLEKQVLLGENEQIRKTCWQVVATKS
jgi:2-polyprenyl-3-methyl-5-hydroxy-6-metoxy-1,4-benzoquinol methylase